MLWTWRTAPGHKRPRPSHAAKHALFGTPPRAPFGTSPAPTGLLPITGPGFYAHGSECTYIVDCARPPPPRGGFRACRRLVLSGMANEHRPFTQLLPIFTTGAAIAVVGSGPLLRFVDPVTVWTVALGLAAAVIINLLTEQEGLERWQQVLAWAFMTSACAVIIWTTSDWIAAARANDRRCLAIQRDMLSARPRRSDSPDLFQALGCRPQGEGSVYAPLTRSLPRDQITHKGGA